MKWIKLTDKEPKFGEVYLLWSKEGEWKSGVLQRIEQTLEGKKYYFEGYLAKMMDPYPTSLDDITHWMKIENPK